MTLLFFLVKADSEGRETNTTFSLVQVFVCGQ